MEFKDFITENRIDYHSSLMEIFKRFCNLKPPDRGAIKRYVLLDAPPTQLLNENINEYETRKKVKKSLLKYAKL